MSTVCGVCGNSNRANAMFCSSCTARLPSFKPSGPSALQALGGMSAAPLAIEAHDAFRPPASSAPSASGLAFWQRLVLALLAMVVVFAAWFVYVTRRAALPSPQSISATAPAVPASPAGRESVRVPPLSPAVEAAVKPPLAEQVPAASASVQPASTVRAVSQPDEDEVARPVSPKRVVARSPATTRVGVPSRSSDPTPAAIARTLAIARADVDLGPPIAAGPGPLYNDAPRGVSRALQDGGPPVAAGTGPFSESSSRGPVRAPAWARNDPGPPIAIGPGPLVDYSTERGRSR